MSSLIVLDVAPSFMETGGGIAVIVLGVVAAIAVVTMAVIALRRRGKR